MNDYQPASRRPIADLFRKTATWPVQVCVRWGIHPDVVSYASVVAAVGAAICFWRGADHPSLLIAGSALCGVRLWFNMLDGMVALASGKASLRGEIVNELPDRVSDVAIFVGVAHSGLCLVLSGYWAAIAALFTAYVGTFGQAVAGRREFGGLMSKPWRMVVLSLGALVTAGLLFAGRGTIVFGDFTILDVACWIVIAGCLQTVCVRLASTLRELHRRAGE